MVAGRHHRRGLFRRRQFHRQQEGGARAAAASDRLAEAARLSAAVLLRGDAQHRQACPDILALMREACFATRVLRHRDAGAGRARRDGEIAQRVMPILEAVATLNRYGIEVVSGIILGLDTDTPDDRRPTDRVHRAVAHPDADDQPVAGPAEDAAMGPARRAGRLLSTTTDANRTSSLPAPMTR